MSAARLTARAQFTARPRSGWTAHVAALACASLIAHAPACGAPRTAYDPASEVVALLDDWHRAAAQADGERYFGSMSADARFLGTDASEHWTLDEFRAYCEPYFAQGKGWTYVPRDRRVAFSAGGDLAWFDERLDNEKYGELRGTGVARRDGDAWKIVHYSMSFPVPNELTPRVVELIRATP